MDKVENTNYKLRCPLCGRIIFSSSEVNISEFICSKCKSTLSIKLSGFNLIIEAKITEN